MKILLWKHTNPNTHICGEKLCHKCNKLVLHDHKCYMKRKLCRGGYCEITLCRLRISHKKRYGKYGC